MFTEMRRLRRVVRSKPGDPDRCLARGQRFTLVELDRFGGGSPGDVGDLIYPEGELNPCPQPEGFQGNGIFLHGGAVQMSPVQMFDADTLGVEF